MGSHKPSSAGSVPRGRPLKEDGSDLSIKRQKNRQAQRILKARRQQEVADKDALISHLEATVDKLAAMHLDLIDECLGSEALHRNPQFTQQLRDSIEKTLHLVKRSATEKKPAGLDSNFDIAVNSLQLAPSPVLNIEAISAESAVENPNSEHALTAEDCLPTVDAVDEGRSWKSLHTEQAEQKGLAPGSLPNDHSFQTIFNTFGNGWTSDLPEPYVRLQASLRNNASSTRDSLGLSIAEYTLYHAYVVLLHTVDPTENSVVQIFGFSLRKHSREELLFNLRWFLGPGYAHINKLAGILTDGANSPVGDIPLLHPAVGADARSEAESLGPSPMSGLPHFMSANDVAVYLTSMKARSVDADVLELTVQDDYRVRISKPLFLEKVSNISACLSHGPNSKFQIAQSTRKLESYTN